MNRKIIFLLTALLAAHGARADATRPGQAEAPADEAAGWAFKLTPSYYATSHQTAAEDLNLRANHGPHAVWLGYYQRGSEFSQARTGYELTLEAPGVKLVPSLQLATHGFAGGAMNLEAGGDLFLLLGYGRTNARDYYNLNFDPNDSVVYGAGTRLLPKSTVSLYTVRDNRLHTEQVITHALLRYQADAARRLTLDLFEKHGRASPDDPKLAGTGLALTYDHHDVFVRLARDRKVNFSPDDQTRVSLGLRF